MQHHTGHSDVVQILRGQFDTGSFEAELEDRDMEAELLQCYRKHMS